MAPPLCSQQIGSTAYDPSISEPATMPAAAAAPPPTAATRQAFEELQNRFEYDQKVTEKILELGVRSMSDFRYYPADASDAAHAIVESITDMEQSAKRIQAAPESCMECSLQGCCLRKPCKALSRHSSIVTRCISLLSSSLGIDSSPSSAEV